jgi:hypothetical protein
VASPHSTAARPEARTESVDALVAMVLTGQVRIPLLEHAMSWDGNDVVELFDSIHRGFPIGSLLLREGPAEAAEVHVGPLPVLGAERRDALWVIDGQQRLTSLTVALGRPEPVPTTPDDPFAIYFDAATREFRSPPRTGGIASTWVPLPRLLEASRLTEWVQAWSHHASTELRAHVFEAGRRLREYRVPLCVINTTDEDLLHTMFVRANKTGKALPWSELRHGLFGPRRALPASLAELADELATLGMGRPEEAELLPCVAAHQGLDVPLRIDEHLRGDAAVPASAAAAALPALRRALGFLRSQCKIPHLSLLPYPVLLVVLTRFFRDHPEPNDRTQTLLVRWTWRAFLTPEPDERALAREGVAAIAADEERSMQALLRIVPASPVELAVPATFDARGAQSRLALLGMASLGPRNLHRHQPTIDVAALIRERDASAYRPLFPPDGGETRGAANRILLPGDGPAAPALRTFIELHGVDDPALRSHAIDPIVAAAIRDRAPERALARRAQLLASSVTTLGRRMAAWGRSDAPSVEYLMRQGSP